MAKSFKKIKRDIQKVAPNVVVTKTRGTVVLTGELEHWEDVVAVGNLAVSKRFLGVVNRVTLKGFAEVPSAPITSDKTLDGKTPDCLVIGGGVVGSAIARALTKYQLDVMLVEKEDDVAMGASSRNDGDVHVGIDLHFGQQKLKYNSRGNQMFDKEASDLGVKFERTGHVVLFYKPYERFIFAPLMVLKTKLLGIKGVKYLKREELLKLEPGIPSWASGGLFMPSGGEVSPYKFTVALAENAAENGANIHLGTMVLAMSVENGAIKSVATNRGTIYPKLVINAAGIYSDHIADMAGDRTFTIHPRKGVNLILDKKCRHYAATSMNKSPFSRLKDPEANAAVAQKNTKGGGVVHTVDGNVLIGPTSQETPYREDNTTDQASIDTLYRRLKSVAEEMQPSDIITYFAGTRAATYEEDFVVRKGVYTKNIIEAAGIQSPGLGSAPAIAEDVALWASQMLGGVAKNEKYNPIRKATPHLAELNEEARNQLILANPSYGEMVCRCEEISKGEVLDVLNSPLPVYTVDAVKRRARAGMGRCQGGFCSPLVMDIIAKHQNRKIEEIEKSREGSTILFGNTKGGAQ